MAVTSADPWAAIRVDCSSVQQGSQKGLAWAAAPDRCLARVWAPLNAALDDDPERVVWMPAHCSQAAVGSKRLGNGELLTALDVTGNALVDGLAKEAARADRRPRQHREAVRELGEIVTAVATWIGQATQLANHLPDPRQTGTDKQSWLRDSEGRRGAKASGQRPGAERCSMGMSDAQLQPEPSMVQHSQVADQRWTALQERVKRKELAPCSDRSSLVEVLVENTASDRRSPVGLLPGGSRKRRRPAQSFLGAAFRGAEQVPSVGNLGKRPCPETGQLPEGHAQPLEERPEKTEFEVLQELASDGLRVTWPLGKPSSGRGDLAPEGLPTARRAALETRPRGSGCLQVLGSEWQEALAELEELEKNGLQVKRPG